MNIAFFILDYSVMGGVERATSSLINLFERNSIPVKTLYSGLQTNSKSEFAFSSAINIDVIGTNNPQSLLHLLSNKLKLDKIDLLIFAGDNMSISLAVLEACNKVGCHAIPQYHGSPYAYLRKYFSKDELRSNPSLILKQIWSFIVRPAKKRKLSKYIKSPMLTLACVSRGSANELKQLFKTSISSSHLEKIGTIHNPLSFNVNKINTDYATKENSVVYLSRLETKHKNSMLVLETWLHIHDHYPHWTLQIIGDGSIRERMEQFCILNGMKNVNFHGLVKEVGPHLEKSKISILTSNCEGLGLGLIESGLYENALVSTAADGGVKDIISNSQEGLLANRGDHTRLAEHLKYLMDNSDECHKLALHIRAKIKNTFNDKIIIMQWRQELSKTTLR